MDRSPCTHGERKCRVVCSFNAWINSPNAVWQYARSTARLDLYSISCHPSSLSLNTYYFSNWPVSEFVDATYKPSYTLFTVAFAMTVCSRLRLVLWCWENEKPLVFLLNNAEDEAFSTMKWTTTSVEFQLQYTSDLYRIHIVTDLYSIPTIHPLYFFSFEMVYYTIYTTVINLC